MNEKFSILHEAAGAEPSIKRILRKNEYVRYCQCYTQKTRCCQVTKTHVIDFGQSRAWILYNERRSYVNI